MFNFPTSDTVNAVGCKFLNSFAIGGVLSDKQVARRSSNGGSRLHANRHWNIDQSAKAIRAKSNNQLNHKISFPRTSNTVANVCDWHGRLGGDRFLASIIGLFAVRDSTRCRFSA